MAGKNGYNILVVLIIIGAVGVCTMAAYTLMADAGEAAAPDDYLLKITSEEELRQFLNENSGYRYSEYDSGFAPRTTKIQFHRKSQRDPCLPR